jgi:ribosomal protein L9
VSKVPLRELFLQKKKKGCRGSRRKRKKRKKRKRRKKKEEEEEEEEEKEAKDLQNVLQKNKSCKGTFNTDNTFVGMFSAKNKEKDGPIELLSMLRKAWRVFFLEQ